MKNKLLKALDYLDTPIRNVNENETIEIVGSMLPDILPRTISLNTLSPYQMLNVLGDKIDILLTEQNNKISILDISSNKKEFFIKNYNSLIKLSRDELIHVYVQPTHLVINGKKPGTRNFIVVDDIDIVAVSHIIDSGLNPSLIIESSTDNYQAVFMLNKYIDNSIIKNIKYMLTTFYDGDMLCDFDRQFFRVAGTYNVKSKRILKNGKYPVVNLLVCDNNREFPLDMFIAKLKEMPFVDFIDLNRYRRGLDKAASDNRKYKKMENR